MKKTLVILAAGIGSRFGGVTRRGCTVNDGKLTHINETKNSSQSS